MGRVAKKAPEAAAKAVEESPAPTITQTRARRTPKPNPKYTNEAVVLPPKAESSDTEDTEEKPATVVKSVKKVAETPASAKGAKAAGGRGRPGKKQKLDYDDAEETEDAKPTEDEKPAGPRATRSKASDSLKVGDDSVAIIDVSSIISKTPAKPESPKPTPKAGPGRKRTGPEESPKEDQAKKKKEEEKPSLITARKSYMPSSALGKKAEMKIEKEDLEEPPKTPASTIKTRRNAISSAGETPLAEPAEKKIKVEEVKQPLETKRVPIVRKTEPIAKVTTIVKSPAALPTKIVSPSPKPIPRILNSMVTPKGKQSPNVKLTGDGTDKKVFSIDLTDDSIKEKKIIVSPMKSPPLKSPPVAVKENVAYNKPQPSMVLKNRLESELSRMKASAASMIRRQIIPAHRQTLPTQAPNFQMSGPGGTRRITKFESWYVIDVKNLEPTPFRHQHTQSLIKLGNSIKEVQLPSDSWDYKISLQRRLPRKENNNEEEVYEGEVTDKSMELDKHNYEPSSILFKRSHRESNKISIDRSLMLKSNMYTITMNGKQCKLIGAPDDIKSTEDIEILLSIIDSCTLSHSCVELVTNHDIITIM